ncbi:hypothetical protein NOGI109294_26005 [Nocardiopsis gilva]
MNDHKARASGGNTRFPVSEEKEAACGPACVTAGACACGAGDGDAARAGAAVAAPNRSDRSAQTVWAPAECTLDVVQLPDRIAQFDALFADAVRAVARLEPTRLRLVVDIGYGAAAWDLAARESGCCSFFTFAFTRHADRLHWEMTVPPTQKTVLDALAARASAALEQSP